MSAVFIVNAGIRHGENTGLLNAEMVCMVGEAFKAAGCAVAVTDLNPKVCGTDGRTRSDPSRRYGTGGFLTQKRYWFSTTWNAPSFAVLDVYKNPTIPEDLARWKTAVGKAAEALAGR